MRLHPLEENHAASFISSLNTIEILLYSKFQPKASKVCFFLFQSLYTVYTLPEQDILRQL